MLKRASGVLLNISSLPSDFGIGGFGQEIEFGCNFLKSGGFSYWQVLPLTTIGLGNSPYSSESAFAINYLYTDPIDLLKKGYISAEDVEYVKSKNSPYIVNYSDVIQKKTYILRLAYNNKKEELKEKLKKFAKSKSWINDYAMYKTLKHKFENKSWIYWPKEYKNKEDIDLKKFMLENSDDYYFYIFEQFILNEQWNESKKILLNNGIKIIGDMPMYVSLDSSDVWANTKYFLLDKNKMPKKVAGVPPDYFSADGQLWGNPLYDYKAMAQDNYKWWMDRIDQMMYLYDILRIDHFRAFSEYWAVPAKAKTAKEGMWCSGVGMKLFNEIFKKYDKDRFIAEDLGIIDNKVISLLKKTGLPGMRVMHFGFGGDDNIHLPHNYVKNCVGYTATHDNNTSLGWLFELDEKTREDVLNYIKCDKNIWGVGAFDSVSVKLMIKKVMESECMLAIIPIQDLFGFGSDCRMNTPGIANGNWEYRAVKDQFESCRMNYYLSLNKSTGRTL